MNTETQHTGKVAFLLDDGWVLEKRETARALQQSCGVEILTHDALTYEQLKGEFEVILLERRKLQGILAFLVMFFANDLQTQFARTARNHRIKGMHGLERWGHQFRALLGCVGLRPYNVHDAFGFLYRKSDDYGEVLERYHTIIYNTVSVADKRVLYEARNRGIHRFSWVYSWDNPIKDNEFIPDAEHYLVWNTFTRQDLKEVHGVPEERISISGPVQFEFLLGDSKLKDETHTPFVLFACATAHDEYVEQEVDLILLTRKILDRVAPALELHVRPYPFRKTENVFKYKRLDDVPGIKVLYFGEVQGGTIVPDEKDRDEKRRQFEEAECFVNVGSTIGLEASFFPVPILQIAFSLESEHKQKLDLAEQFKNEHLRYMIDDRFANTCRDAAAYEQALAEIFQQRNLQPYKAYSAHLQEFANPFLTESFLAEFCNQVVVAAQAGYSPKGESE